jgi:hypothetical protein
MICKKLQACLLRLHEASAKQVRQAGRKYTPDLRPAEMRGNFGTHLI